MSIHPFAATLLRWFDGHGRDLPWRHSTDPYLIWLSEIILQQTRVQQGWAYWERFVRRWPTVESLAAANEDDVLREWQGLGYYSRARNLHTAAKQIVGMGSFPCTIETIRKLKGVGDYTAAAIGSIAFGLPVAVVDGNVYRVLARHFGIETPINTTKGKKEFTALAQSLLPAQQASTFNQAMMDFGAVQCTPQSPSCQECPLVETCDALRKGRVEELPVKLRTLRVKTRRMTYIYIRYKGEVAIHRRGPGDIWQGLWEPYLVEEGDICADAVVAPVVSLLQPVRRNVRHVLTHRVLLADFFLWEAEERPSLPKDYKWVKEKNIDNYGIPRLIEILLTELNH